MLELPSQFISYRGLQRSCLSIKCMHVFTDNITRALKIIIIIVIITITIKNNIVQST